MITGNEPRDWVEQLEAERAEHQRAADRIAAELGGRPLWRERNWFFHQLLNSDVDTYERVRALWREQRRNRKMVRRLDRRIGAAVERAVASEPGYLKLGTKAREEKEARRAGKALLASISVVRQRLDRAIAGDFSRATKKSDARDVSRLLGRVHQRADQLTARLSRGAVDSDSLAKLHVTFHIGDTPEERKKQYLEIKAALAALARNVGALMREVGEREKEVKAKQRQYLRDGRTRYER